eukprot:37903-Eustigmatos_ZCMA.PRE.1
MLGVLVFCGAGYAMTLMHIYLITHVISCLSGRGRNSVGHTGKFGHEFMEFEIQPSGLLRYANNSNYKNAKMIRKQGEQSA